MSGWLKVVVIVGVMGAIGLLVTNLLYWPKQNESMRRAYNEQVLKDLNAITESHSSDEKLPASTTN